LDKEAVRVVSSSPQWTPGKHNGETAKVQYNFPVVFALSNGNASKSTATSTLSARQAPVSEDGVVNFELAAQKPNFQGGDEHDFSRWVSEQVNYPEIAKVNGIQGRVVITFVVDTDGTVKEVAVLRGIDPALDKEAVRAISSSPKWTPGMDGNGNTIPVRYNFPVVFQLR